MSKRASWAALVAAAVVILGVMLWVTSQMLDLEERHRRAEHRANVEEQVRLALWRLDSFIPPLLSEELANVRLAADGQPATSPPPFVRARFVLDEDGSTRWFGLGDTSPPEVSFETLADRLEQPAAALIASAPELNEGEVQQQVANPSRLDSSVQAYRNVSEWSKRASSTIAIYDNPDNAVDNLLSKGSKTTAPDEGPSSRTKRAGGLMDGGEPTTAGRLRPVWVGGDLVVARLVRTADDVKVHGSVIDWPAWREELQAEVTDLLPEGSLQPAPDVAEAEVSRALASLPVVLDPGVTAIAASGFSPVGWSLVVGWVFAIAALAAMAALVAASLSLSDRRAAFVSAVTHELRTPLTTFRMYAEMLSEGMVESNKQQRYLRTLRTEADRLGHLVENVLAYARLESRSTAVQREPVQVGDLVRRIEGRLTDRAHAAGLGLALHVEDETGSIELHTDPTAIEQILFNLVDNAAKYAAEGDDPRVDVEVRASDHEVAWTVRDRGPGIPPADRRRIFEPFAKAAADEAGTRPGAGLGLALCRQQARRLRGELELTDEGPGATFRLSIPRGRHRAT